VNETGIGLLLRIVYIKHTRVRLARVKLNSTTAKCGQNLFWELMAPEIGGPVNLSGLSKHCSATAAGRDAGGVPVRRCSDKPSSGPDIATTRQATSAAARYPPSITLLPPADANRASVHHVSAEKPPTKNEIDFEAGNVMTTQAGMDRRRHTTEINIRHQIPTSHNICQSSYNRQTAQKLRYQG